MMSIAIAVVLRPSKKLQILAILFSILWGLVAVYLGYVTSIAFQFRAVLVLACFTVFLFNLKYLYGTLTNCWHLSISGQGEFHCALISNQRPDQLNVESYPYKLAAGSILWSRMLILRLKRFNDDNMINLVVLSDAVSDDEFRRLAIACRWISSHARSKST